MISLPKRLMAYFTPLTCLAAFSSSLDLLICQETHDIFLHRHACYSSLHWDSLHVSSISSYSMFYVWESIMILHMHAFPKGKYRSIYITYYTAPNFATCPSSEGHFLDMYGSPETSLGNTQNFPKAASLWAFWNYLFWKFYCYICLPCKIMYEKMPDRIDVIMDWLVGDLFDSTISLLSCFHIFARIHWESLMWLFSCE